MDKAEQEENVFDQLLQILELEKVGDNEFRGASLDLGLGNVFGGQTIGQGLSAAKQSVQSDRIAHSLHAYFMKPGDPSQSITYVVDPIRDSKTFNTRHVRVVQNHNDIGCISVSFKIPESGFSHQDEMPDVVGPEGLESELEFAWRIKDKIPDDIRDRLLKERPIEIRPVNPMDPFEPEKKSPDRYTWFRAKQSMPEDHSLHRKLLAYASDFGLVAASMYPHATTFWDPQMKVASLDHALWFHRDFRVDEWLLYAIHSPNASNGRGLNIGRIFTRDGRLVASTAQECLIRHR